MNSRVGKNFLFNAAIVPVSQGNSVLECILKAGIEIDHSCGGYGTCGTCVVKVIEGLEKLEARNEIEAEISIDRKFTRQERLACQIYSVSEVSFSKPLPVIKKGFE